MHTYKTLAADPNFPIHSLSKLQHLVKEGVLEVDKTVRPCQFIQESIDRYLREHNDFRVDVISIKEAAKIFGSKHAVFLLVREGLLEKVTRLNRSYITKKSIKLYEEFKERFGKTKV